MVALTTVLSAHIVEVTGTILSRDGANLEVGTADGTVTVKLEANTAVMRNKRRVEQDQLKPGVRIEAQTLDDTDAELVAFLVTILPAKE